jgi:hypothetical protein
MTHNPMKKNNKMSLQTLTGRVIQQLLLSNKNFFIATSCLEK